MTLGAVVDRRRNTELGEHAPRAAEGDVARSVGRGDRKVVERGEHGIEQPRIRRVAREAKRQLGDRARSGESIELRGELWPRACDVERASVSSSRPALDLQFGRFPARRDPARRRSGACDLLAPRASTDRTPASRVTSLRIRDDSR